MTDSNQHDDEEDGADTSFVTVSANSEAAGASHLLNESGIYIRAEIEGPGEQVLSHLTGSSEPTYKYEGLQSLVEDMTTILEEVDRTGGGIRSKVSAETNVSATDEGIRHMLELLREYELLALEGNSWRPGPALKRDTE